MNRDKSVETASENDDTDAELVAYSLTGCTDLDFHSDSEYMEPVSIYSEPSDCGTATRLQNNSGTMSPTETGRYATVCVAPAPRTHPPTLPDPNGIRRVRRAENRHGSLICSRMKLKRRWEVVERFVEKKNITFLCAALVMGIFGCVAFFISVGVAARGTCTGWSTCCTCAAPDIAQSIALTQTNPVQSTAESVSPSLAGIGVPGLPGPPGPRGEKGEPGLKGEVGEQGKRGKRGIQGENGVGVKGDRGDVGPPGPAGGKGLPGQKGESGSLGLRGAPGARGIRGDKGDKGDLGPRGYTGYTGQSGRQGLPGVQGVKGSKGDKGEPGRKGERGQA